MSHSRFIFLNDNQKITLIKDSLKKQIEVLFEDSFYFKEKTFSVFICEEEMKAISIMFENKNLLNIHTFFDFLTQVFESPNKEQFYNLHILHDTDFIRLNIGVRNKYQNCGFMRDIYKFKLREKQIF